MIDSYKLLGVRILSCYSCAHRSVHDVSGNCQQDKCYTLFSNFMYLYEWESVIPVKLRTLRMGCPAHFRL